MDLPLSIAKPGNYRRNNMADLSQASTDNKEESYVALKVSKENTQATNTTNHSRASTSTNITFKENISHIKHSSTNTSINHSHKKLPSSKKNTGGRSGNISPSPNHKEGKENHNTTNQLNNSATKIATLEYRLIGANKTIKSMEREMKIKDEKIQEVLKELEKKNRFVDMMQVNTHF